MTIEQEIKTLKSAYQHNSEALDAIKATSHIFIDMITGVLEEHSRKLSRSQVKKAKTPALSPAQTLIKSVVDSYPEDFRPHLQKVVDETAKSISAGIVDTCVRTAAKLPEDPEALDSHDFLKALVDHQLDQLRPQLSGEPGVLASDLLTIDAALVHDLMKSVPDQALAVLKDFASGKLTLPQQ